MKLRKCLFGIIVLVPFAVVLLMLCVVFVSIFQSNTRDISEAKVLSLIHDYFDVDISNSCDIVYKDYGSNIREEYFTIAITCTSEELMNELNAMTNAYEQSYDDELYAKSILGNIIPVYEGVKTAIWREFDSLGNAVGTLIIPEGSSYAIFVWDP